MYRKIRMLIKTIIVYKVSLLILTSCELVMRDVIFIDRLCHNVVLIKIWINPLE